MLNKRSKKYKEKRLFISREKKLEKKHLRILIGLAILGACYYYFLQPKTIGHDIRYTIYIFGLPTFLGLITFAIYRRRFLANKFLTNKGFILWAFMIFYYTLQGVVFSYLSFGQCAQIAWDILNERAARKNPIEALSFDVTRFWTGKGPTIDFKLNGRNERIKVPYQEIKNYIGENPKDYEIIIEAQHGIWNYYKFINWSVRNK